MAVRNELPEVKFIYDKNSLFFINVSGYALKDVAVWYMMKENLEVFERLGRTWDSDENSYCHV